VNRRAALAAVAALPLALAACPLPQPLAEVARTVDGGSVTTPIILPEKSIPPDTVVLVRRDCPPPGAQFTLGATVEDVDTEELVEARWFVDYQPEIPAGYVGSTDVPPSADPNDARRSVGAFVFRPYDYGVAVPLHIVDVVVSNNFLLLSDPTPPKQRAAPPPFATQLYRWVFQYVDAGDPRGRGCP
jgi:hypothetical protein